MTLALLFAASIANRRDKRCIIPMDLFRGLLTLPAVSNIWTIFQRINIPTEPLQKKFLKGHKRIIPFEEVKDIPKDAILSFQLSEIFEIARHYAEGKKRRKDRANRKAGKLTRVKTCIGVKEFLIACALHGDNEIMDTFDKYEFSITAILESIPVRG